MSEHNLSWRGIPLDQLSREQLLEALSNAYWHIGALKDERHALERRIYGADADVAETDV